MYRYSENDVRSRIITEELNNNYEKNEIFFGYPTSMINAIKDVLIKTNENEIVIDLTEQELKRLSKHTSPNRLGKCNILLGTPEMLEFWNHLIALIIMKELEKRYNFKCSHDLEEEEKYFTEKSYKEYKKVSDTLVTREDVFNTIDSLCLISPRLHIIRRYPLLAEECEVDCYLQDEHPFITMIYSDSEYCRPQYGIWHDEVDENGKTYSEKNKYRLFYQEMLVEDTYRYKRKK